MKTLLYHFPLIQPNEGIPRGYLETMSDHQQVIFWWPLCFQLYLFSLVGVLFYCLMILYLEYPFLFSDDTISRISFTLISSVAQLCPTLCNPMDCSTTGFPVHHQLPELARTHIYQVGDAIQPSHPLPSSSPSAFNLSQHQSLFQWISSSYQVAKVLELQLEVISHYNFDLPSQSISWNFLWSLISTEIFTSLYYI